MCDDISSFSQRSALTLSNHLPFGLPIAIALLPPYFSLPFTCPYPLNLHFLRHSPIFFVSLFLPFLILSSFLNMTTTVVYFCKHYLMVGLYRHMSLNCCQLTSCLKVMTYRQLQHTQCVIGTSFDSSVHISSAQSDFNYRIRSLRLCY